ncbi:ATPase AAA [Clostridia bacterium]|nr:ATPase AAA [Clostridia bacterium]
MKSANDRSSPSAPQILVFAGPNGSGKSSVTSAWQTVGIYINADDIKVRRNSTDLEAAREAEQLRESCLNERRSFTFETVLSTDRNLDFLARAKATGFCIEGVYVLTSNAELNVFRVHSRELNGGHGVPSDKIRSRYTKSLANIPRLLALCSTFRIIDNTVEPETIYFKDAHITQIRPNRFWTAEAIEKLTYSLS